jgi:hypothetical protein
LVVAHGVSGPRPNLIVVRRSVTTPSCASTGGHVIQLWAIAVTLCYTERRPRCAACTLERIGTSSADSFIYALVLSQALTELLPKSGMDGSPANVGFVGSILFALFLVVGGLLYSVTRLQSRPASQFYQGMDENNCPTQESLSSDIFR